ncbi:MAG: DNA cytosine methyltransferase [Limisphaerales bacterium]
MNEKRTHIDLFSGIGGFAVAAGWAGYRTVAFCEQDKYCTKVLNRHWPDVPVIPDIRDFDGSKWRGAGLLTGGFPCQPFSVCGERRGSSDDRALWPEMFRIIKEARPRWVLGENVAGLINMALDEVLSQLESEGYSTGAVVLPACAYGGCPHRRDRLWFMAHTDQPRLEGHRKFRKRTRKGTAWESVPEHLWDETPSRVLRMVNGFASWPHRSERIQAIGNSISAPLAHQILKLL